MNESRPSWKVGIFVVIGLLLIGGLMLTFSKASSIFNPSYTIKLKTTNVGGIRSQAAVVLAGVGIGRVTSVELQDGGKSVIMNAKIFKKFQIYKDSIFLIDTVGVLGDQYIAIKPNSGMGEFLKDGDTVRCEEPFNIGEVARASVGFISRLDQTVVHLNQIITRIDQTTLNQETLTNLSMTIGNLQDVSKRAIVTMDRVNKIVESNAVPINASINNIVQFSEQLDRLGSELNVLLNTNRSDFSMAVNNFKDASAGVKEIVENVRSGKGVVGGLLSDELAKQQLFDIIQNMTVLSSNLSHHGILYKPKQPKATAPVRAYEGKVN
ncbi:MAG: ttg2C [Verrucomicrobiales bacterium]|nr:ttg2C [Verrucomicrobiales bacterium]